MDAMTSITNKQRAVASIDRLTALIDGSGGGGLTVARATRELARARALELLETSSEQPNAPAYAVLGFAAETFLAIAVDLAAHPPDAQRLIARIDEEVGVPRVVLGREVLHSPHLPQLSTNIAIEVQLALLLAFAEVRAVSLWTLWPGGEVKCISHAGVLDLDATGTRRTAVRLLSGDQPAIDRNAEIGVRIEHLHRDAAALIAHGPAHGDDNRQLLLEAAAPALAAVLDRDQLLARQTPSEEGVLAAVERRLARLRFDLHDGPQQDVHLLATDLSFFREQLRPIIADDPNADRVLGRLDDLAAQLVALDGDLRRLSSTVQSPFLQPGSLPDALRQITDAFAARSGIAPRTQLSGDFSELTDSQQITLLALIREALSNVREHSGAKHVTISIKSRRGGVETQIVDDGQGFDPETTLVRAARDGHLGLVGMHERVRMLGGNTNIESRPGGPTVISVELPSWPGLTRD
jgi:signal transduction histidine kinase